MNPVQADVLTILQRASARLWQVSKLGDGLEEVLAAALELMDAERGHVQLLDQERQILLMAAQRGLSPEFLDVSRKVPLADDSLGSRTLRAQRRIVIEDVETEESFAPVLSIARSIGFRAVQLTPIIGRGGRPLGMISTYHGAPHRPADDRLSGLDMFARQAADFIEHWRMEDSSALLSAIVGSSDDAIISKGLDGVITSWNASAERMFGYSASEAIGRPITMLIPADHLSEEVEIIERLKQGRRIEHFETIRKRKDGTLLNISLTISPMRGADGTIFGASKIARDITERKRIEAALDEHRKRLEELVQALREADRRKDEFLAVLAHELRNPLAPIRTSLELMKLANGDAQTAEHARIIMQRQVAQMVRLVDELLDVSRISRGIVVLKKTRVALLTVLRNAVESSRPALEAAEHALQLDLPAEAIFVDADEVRLSQVFTNLLNNAAKYTPRGGRVRLVAERRGNEAVVTVEDSGQGIPAHMLDKVFDMFTRVDRAADRPQAGLGVGLSIAKQLVTLHSGTIEARSEGSGMGSQFVVRVPILLALIGDEPAGTGAPRAEAARGHRILIIDDNIDAAVTMAMILKLMGHETRTASDGIEGLKVAALFRPELVLLDLGMPNMDGYETCRRIRQQPWAERTTVIAMTGWGQAADKRASREAGFDLHLVKPVDKATLEKVLASVRAKAA